MAFPVSRLAPRLRPATFGTAPRGDRLRRISGSPQYRDGALGNSEPTSVVRPTSNSRVLRAQLTGWRQRRPGMEVPVLRVGADDFARPAASGLRLTWLGHATVLAEIEGRRVLFDPVWSTRCSPFSFVGPSRLHPAPIRLRELPSLDVVAISHDHYDHLDMPTVKTLAEATTARFAVPLGIGAHLEHWGIPQDRIIELDWHETAHIGGLALTATPARHYCGRGLGASRTALWSSWVVAGERRRIFHGGDTGYFSGLSRIGAEHGPFDATMLPVGAYHELWPDVHMTPEEAVRAHHDLRGSVMLPIHWATYALAPHPWSEPMDRTVAAARKHGTSLVTPRPGEPIEPAAGSFEPAVDVWWRPGRTAVPPTGRVPAPDRLRHRARSLLLDPAVVIRQGVSIRDRLGEALSAVGSDRPRGGD